LNRTARSPEVPTASVEDDHTGRPFGSSEIWGLITLALFCLLGAAVVYEWIMRAHATVLFRGQNISLLKIWAILMGATTGCALAVGVWMGSWLYFFLRRFARPIGRRTWASWMFIIVVIMGTALIVSVLVLPSSSVTVKHIDLQHRQTQVVTAIGVAAALPGILGFLAIHSMATRKEEWPAQPEDVALAAIVRSIDIRRDLQRILAGLGLLLTILVITTAARRQEVLSVAPTSAFPPEFVTLYGLIFAALLAFFHGIATAALNFRCRSLLDELTELPQPNNPDLTTRLERRDALGAALGLSGSWFASFQSGVIILAPLLTALIGSAFPGK
jgi:hypothetical protein